MTYQCVTCGQKDYLTVSTYKRRWLICRHCGTAVSDKKNSYPFSFLPYDDVKRQKELSAESMYDYFVEEHNFRLSEESADELLDKFIYPNQIDLSGKTILDISGGNGHVAKKLQSLGAHPTLTEINQKTIDYANKAHSFDAFKYDLNVDNIYQVTGRKFDVIFARACIMFCDDIADFAIQVKEALNPNGLLIIENSVKPTLGTLVRVQLDEYSYHVLRQPETIIETFSKLGFKNTFRWEETDSSLYVYDHDLLPHWMFLHYFYEIRGARLLKNERIYDLPARDRRRNTFIFEYA